MIRQNPVSNPQETSQAGDPELGRWLTRDLRAKGAPLSSAPPPSTSAAPSAPPSEAEVLAGWLTRDLTPKHSTHPRAASVPPAAKLSGLPPAAKPSELPQAAPPPPSVMMPFAPAPRDDQFSVPPPRSPFPLAAPSPVAAPPPPQAAPSPAVVVASAGVAEPSVAPGPVDTLAPQMVPPDAASLPVLAPGVLEDDDLAVLPGRRRAAGSERKKYAFVLLGVLCFAAAIVIGVRQRGGVDAGGSASAASSTDESAALPPPPPSEDELLATPEAAPAPPVRRAGNRSEAPDDALDPLDSIDSLGGPSVRRYADVPSPTLSRLAREQRRLARERDEALRKAKAKDIPR
jgi:hypothetical protein